MTKELIDDLRAEADGCRDQDGPGSVTAVLLDRAADVLEARQPTEGDREAITGNELADAVSVYHEACGKPANSEGVRAVLALSRAAVPDAATERARQAEAELRDMLRVDIPSLKAERDAALAAVERVRAILDRDDFGDDWEHDEWVYREAAEKKLGEIETALDGAPEPEVKP